MNSYLNDQGLPRFNAIAPEGVEQHFDDCIQQAQQTLSALLENTTLSWREFLVQLELLEDRLSREWSPVQHLNAVANNEALREAYANTLQKLTAFHTEMAQNEALYQRYLQIRQADNFPSIDPEYQKVVEDGLRDFRLAGIALDSEKKQQYKQLRQQLAQLQNEFQENVLDATQGWTKRVSDIAALDGLPEYALDLLEQQAKQREQDGWLITLDAPSYIAVLSHANDRALREEVYTAFQTRASDQGPNREQWNNGPLMCEILQLRQQLAELVGFNDYAEYSLQTKMADSAQEAETFLLDLAKRSKSKAQSELDALEIFARETLAIETLAAWDFAFVSERYKEQTIGFSQEQLKPYFSVDRVLQSLFDLVEDLFGVAIRANSNAETWNPDVLFYELLDDQGEVRGAFYLDLYAREHKRGGAWMDVCRTRRQSDGQVQTPVAYMTCNATPPLDDQPALFTHDEVVTLFHEFGHGLHHMLTQVNTAFLSGINGVEWDAVELPSQFMENWCWQEETLRTMAQHYQTGEPIPDDLFTKLLSSRTYNTGLQMLRQIEFALFDLRIHQQKKRLDESDIQSILDAVRAEVSLLVPPAWVRFQNGFSHIFAGGYAAGYYSYKWAEVLSADVYSAFEENQDNRVGVGKHFLHNILERGGTKPAAELFESFRGRGPRIDALLRHSGIAA